MGKLLFCLLSHLEGILGEIVWGYSPVIGGLCHIDCFFLGLFYIATKCCSRILNWVQTFAVNSLSFILLPKQHQRCKEIGAWEYCNMRLQCRRFLWARNLLAKSPCWNFPKRGGNGASQRERGGGGEREEKTPAQKHCENEKHPLIVDACDRSSGNE